VQLREGEGVGWLVGGEEGEFDIPWARRMRERRWRIGGTEPDVRSIDMREQEESNRKPVQRRQRRGTMSTPLGFGGA
jgi:DNA-binding PucR family transcriptional regulator